LGRKGKERYTIPGNEDLRANKHLMYNFIATYFALALLLLV
jgi:hypothetical protein